MLVASDVLPMPGRPATMMRSECDKPPILVSRSRKPVEIPDSFPSRWNAFAARSTASVSACEFLETAVIAAGFGELVEPALGVLDLRPRGEVDWRVIGD